MKSLSIFLAALLITASLVVISGSTVNTTYAEESDNRSDERDRLSAASEGGTGTDPGQVVIASGNNRFAVWHDNTPGNNDIFFRRSTDNGVTWQPIVNLSNNPGPSQDAQITVDGSEVYVVWAQQNAAGTEKHVFLRRSLDNGATWGPHTRISATTTNTITLSNPQIAAAGAFVYITWFDAGPGSTSGGDAFFRRSINNGASFQGIVNLSNSGTVDDFNNDVVAVAAAGTNVYVAWDDFYGSTDVLLRRSTNNGGVFSPIVNITKGGGSDAVGLDLSATGAFGYLSWGYGIPGTTDVFFSRSTNNGGTWSAKVNLSNNAGSSIFPQIAYSGVYVFVTWQDGTPGNLEALMKRSINNGASFQAVKNLSNNAGSSSGPQVATSGPNVYFTWSDTTSGNGDIYLRRSNNNGGTLQPVVQISNNAGVSTLPQVTTVGANVYVIWQDNTPGNFDILERRSHDNGVTWKVVQNLSTNAGQSLLPSIDG